MKTPELKSFPFCGSTKLKLESRQKLVGYNGLDKRVENRTYSVRCNVCHARGGAVGGKVVPEMKLRPDIDLPSWAMTDDVLKEKAIAAWNRRGTDEQSTRR